MAERETSNAPTLWALRGPGGLYYMGEDLEGPWFGPIENAGAWTSEENAEAARRALAGRVDGLTVLPLPTDIALEIGDANPGLLEVSRG